MKKFFSKILIATLVLGIFFVPLQGNFTTTNTASAQVIENNWVYSSFGTIVASDSETACNAKRQISLLIPGANAINVTPCVNTGQNNTDQDVANAQKALDESNFGCSSTKISTWFTHCIVLTIYYLIFIPIASITRLAGHILDFFIFYSINSNAYTNGFIEQGWGVVRDISNIFFIVALLYVAIKTALGLNSSNNKRLIGTIIVMALLINFSLFISKVVIDASNILTKIFYQNIESVDSNGVVQAPDDKGGKSISVGLVKQFDPQKIFKDSSVSISENIGTFFALLLLSIALMVGMIFIFLSVALLFISRVIMLWILMIFAPIAFASYTIPDAKIPGMGHSDWWSQLFNNAFLAPIFVFFLYLIITFADFIKVTVGDTSSTNLGINTLNVNSFQTYMEVIIPFIFIFALLMKAKEITVKMSGEMGKMVTKAGAMGTGLAVGLASGGTALIARTAIGSSAAAFKEGSSRPASGALGRAGRWMQDKPVFRGLRQMSTFNWSKRPEIAANQEILSDGADKKPIRTRKELAETLRNNKLAEIKNKPKENSVDNTEESKTDSNYQSTSTNNNTQYNYTNPATTENKNAPILASSENINNAGVSNIRGESTPTNNQTIGGNITLTGPVTIHGNAEIKGGANMKDNKEEKEKAKEEIAAATEVVMSEVDGEVKEGESPSETKEGESAPAETKIGTTKPDDNTKGVETLKDRVARGDFGAKTQYKVADYLSKSTFDVRNTKFAKMLGKATGMDFSTSILSQDGGKGGWDGVNQRKQKASVDFAGEIMPSGAELSALNALHSDLLTIERRLKANAIQDLEARNELKDKDGNEITGAKREKLIVNEMMKNSSYRSQKNTYDTERVRLEQKRITRRDNYANVAERGDGIDWLMSHVGFYSPANLAAGHQIRQNVKEKVVGFAEKTDTDKIIDALKASKEDK